MVVAFSFSDSRSADTMSELSKSAFSAIVSAELLITLATGVVAPIGATDVAEGQ